MNKCIAVLAIVLTAACGGGADGPVVARTSDHVLTVEKVAELISASPQLPNDPTVVGAIGNLWLDLTLLAERATVDSAMESVDVAAVVNRQVEDRLVRELLEERVVADTVFSDEALRTLYEEEAAGVSVMTSHILLGFPDNAEEAQVDSVTGLARDIADRARSGEDWDALAAAYSQDPGNAQSGGNLGPVSRDGTYVEPFETAALALDEGEISDPVETVFGLHVIRAGERTQPEFEDLREGFRAQMVQSRMVVAESTFVASVEGPEGVVPQEGAVDIVRELVQRPGDRLNGRAANRELVTHRSGGYTAGKFLTWLREQPAQLRDQVAAAPDEPIEDLLRNLAQYDVLLAEARASGAEVPEVAVDSLETGTRQMLIDFTTQLGLMGITALPGENVDDAIDSAVSDALQRVISGQAPLLDLGPIAFALRDEGGGRLYEDQFPAVVASVERSAIPVPSAGLPAPGGAPAGGGAVPPPTGGNPGGG